MSQTDPIAGFLTSIRNGVRAKKAHVDMPASKLKGKIADILKDEGYIAGFEFMDVKSDKSAAHHRMLRVHLRYLDNERREPVIEGIKRISKPGRRVYVSADRIPTVKSGLGVAILTTSNGIVSDRVARSNKWGGEIICSVW